LVSTRVKGELATKSRVLPEGWVRVEGAKKLLKNFGERGIIRKNRVGFAVISVDCSRLEQMADESFIQDPRKEG